MDIGSSGFLMGQIMSTTSNVLNVDACSGADQATAVAAVPLWMKAGKFSIWMISMKTRQKKAAVRQRARYARERMEIICHGIVDYDEDIYNYDKDISMWKIMEERLEETGMMTKQEFTNAYRDVTTSAGERQYEENREKILRQVRSTTDRYLDPELRAIIAQVYVMGFNGGCYRFMEDQYRKMRKRENEFHW